MKHISDVPLTDPTALSKIDDSSKDAAYESLKQFLSTYQGHAYGKGYGVVLFAKNKNEEAQHITYMCDKGGKFQDRKNKNLHLSKKRKNAGYRKTYCPFRIISKEQAVGWRGYVLEEFHNHDPSDDPIAHPSRRTKK